MRIPDSDVAGAHAIEVMLDDLPFPMSKRELVERAGLWRAPFVNETRRDEPLGPLLARLPDRTYHSPREVAQALRR